MTLSGLFSVLSYIVEQQATDIGGAHGARRDHEKLVEIVLSQSLRPVAIGLVAGGGLATALALALMSTPLASQVRSIVHVFDPAAYAASGLVIAAACLLGAAVPALRAARIDPMTTLRNV